MTIQGTSGNDNLTGTSGNDTFNVSQGGNDTVSGGDGDDTINFGATLTAADTVDGGTGTDTVLLDGDYSHNLTLGAATLTNVEKLVFRAGNSYRITTVDQNVAAGALLVVNGSALGTGDKLTFDGSAETDGTFHFIGGAGNDRLIGSTGADSFDLTRGGTDSVQGGQGDDVINAGASLDVKDQIRGGAGNDTLILGNGASVAFNATTVLSVEKIVAQFSEHLSIDAATITPGTTMTFDASGATGALQLDVSDKMSGELVAVTGSSAADSINFGAAYEAGDSFNGNGGSDKVLLSGDYASGLDLSGLTNIGTLQLLGGFDYDLNLGTASITTINTKAAGAVTIDGTNEMAPTEVVAGSGAVDFTTPFAASEMLGGAGNDTLTVLAGTASSDGIFRGGDGYNTLVLHQNYNLAGLQEVQEIDLGPGIGHFSINIGAAIGKEVNSLEKIDGHLLDVSESIQVVGQNGRGINIGIGGAGTDLIEGAGGATLTGNGGADELWGSLQRVSGGANFILGHDTFVYNAVSDSTGPAYDTITYFNEDSDHFQLWFSVAAVDSAIATGQLDSGANFDAELATAVGSGQLAAGHAVVFTPDSGTLAHDHILVIDANGTAGYQAGQDLVILLDQSGDGAVTASNFTT